MMIRLNSSLHWIGLSILVRVKLFSRIVRVKHFLLGLNSSLGLLGLSILVELFSLLIMTKHFG